MNREKIKKLIEATYLYSHGIDNTQAMDYLTMECTNSEWNFVAEMQDFIDELEVDNGNGTIYQTEKVFAKREKRECRYPSTLLLFGLDEEIMRSNANVQIKKLADEFTKRNIKFINTMV